jgi:hypothetical protein
MESKRKMMQQAKFKRLVLPILFMASVSQSLAQESTVYASVVVKRGFVVGTANPQTGLFYQRPSDDTTWQHTGSNNIRAFGLAVHTLARTVDLHRFRQWCTQNGGWRKKLENHYGLGNHRSALGEHQSKRPANGLHGNGAYGIYKTSDAGVTWKQMNTGLTSTFTSSVILDHANSNALLLDRRRRLQQR